MAPVDQTVDAARHPSPVEKLRSAGAKIATAVAERTKSHHDGTEHNEESGGDTKQRHPSPLKAAAHMASAKAHHVATTATTAAATRALSPKRGAHQSPIKKLATTAAVTVAARALSPNKHHSPIKKLATTAAGTAAARALSPDRDHKSPVKKLVGVAASVGALVAASKGVKHATGTSSASSHSDDSDNGDSEGHHLRSKAKAAVTGTVAPTTAVKHKAHSAEVKVGGGIGKMAGMKAGGEVGEMIGTKIAQTIVDDHHTTKHSDD